MNNIFVGFVLTIAIIIGGPYTLDNSDMIQQMQDCCQGFGCPICDPMIPPPPPPEPEGPPSPRDSKLELIIQKSNEGGFTNDLFWWLRK